MEFLLVIVGLAALFWVGVVFLRGGLVGGSLLVLLAGSCFGHPFFSIPAGPLPLTADRVLLAILIIQCFLYRRWGWLDPRPFDKFDYLMAAFLLVLTASTFTHDFQFRKNLPLTQLAFYFWIPAAMYWVARQTEFSQRSASWIFGTLGVFGVYLCLTAVAETHQWWWIVSPKYIASLDSREFLGRGRGPFLNPAANGLVMGLGMCAGLMWWPRLSRFGRLLLLAGLPIFLYGVYSTFTRSAWMGAALALAVVVSLSMPRNWRVAVIGTAGFASVIVLASTWQNFVAFKRDKELSAEEAAESARLRPILAVVAWHMFLDRPLLGCGYGQYIQAKQEYLADRSTDLPLEKARPFIQHNVFLSLLTETGLAGAGLFVALLFYWARAAWRLWREEVAPLWMRQIGLLFLALLSLYLANGMFQDVSIIPMMNTLLFYFAGAVMGLAPEATSATTAKRIKLWLPEAELATSH